MATIYKRYLNLALPQGQSAFLWGARKTGKSTYLAKHFPNSFYYNLLKTNEFFRLLRQPHLLREDVAALTKEQLKHPIIIDEVQKIPELLDEVHLLIETTPAYFILCGSSARKLKRVGVNLLGGRAWRYEFYPLVYPEITDFDLLHALNHGLIPSHYLTMHWNKTIKAYVQDYLKEEIKEEGLVRNLRAFAEFLEAAAFSNGELINYKNIAADCGVDAKTVKEYYQILVDTLLGYYLYPYTRKSKRSNITSTPKFYLFDVGVVNHLMKRTIGALKGNIAGNAFEHYILMELIGHRGLCDLEHQICFWRTANGLEVDFILGHAEVAIEVKVSSDIKRTDIKGLLAFQEEYQPKRCIVVCTTERKRLLTINGKQKVEILPWQDFLNELWQGKIMS